MGLQIPDNPVGFHSHIIPLHKHLQMTERVYDKPSRLNISENIIQQASVAGLQDEIWRCADYAELVLLFHFTEVPPEVLRIPIDLVRELFEGYIDPRLSTLHSVDKVLQSQGCLSRACASREHDSVTRHEPSSKHLVKLDNSSLYPTTFRYSTGKQLVELRGSGLGSWCAHFATPIWTVLRWFATDSRISRSLARSRNTTSEAPILFCFRSPNCRSSLRSEMTVMVVLPILRAIPSTVSISPGFLWKRMRRSPLTSDASSVERISPPLISACSPRNRLLSLFPATSHSRIVRPSCRVCSVFGRDL